MQERAAHWSGAYSRTGPTRVSWHQDRATGSTAMLATAGVGVQDAVIDVGAGASILVDELLAAGHQDVTALDVSAGALAATRQRLGKAAAARVRWVVADVLDWEPPRRYLAWHDRAVFHFLTD